ncbi:hypothetical protein [Marinibacterium sp. SX1]|uniref:hypothetical protein n=1 Tax=Marinibacterium sp. SX1 TaxID=3388424 RepID=UPI003D16F795
MANGLKGEVAITIDGKVWVLVIDFNALCDFEEVTGVNSMTFIAEFEDDKRTPSALHMRAFIHSMLKERQPDATRADAGRVLSADPDVLIRAFNAAFPTPEEIGDQPGKATAAQS